jgi:hypothetical protein
MLNSNFFKTHDAHQFQRHLSESRLAAALRERAGPVAGPSHIRRWIEGKFVSVPV